MSAGDAPASGGRFRPGLVVVSGPSGSGKTTIVERLADDPRVEVAVTATTRPRRPGERDGVDYHFLSREEFEDRIRRGEFLEYNEVFRNGHLYGSLRAPLEEALARGDRIYVLEIDVEGGLTLKDKGYEGTYVFIAPPSLEELERRIRSRGTEDEEAVRRRLEKARFELENAERYDCVVVNDDLERAVGEVRRILGLDPSGEPTPGGGAGDETRPGGRSR